MTRGRDLPTIFLAEGRLAEPRGTEGSPEETSQLVADTPLAASSAPAQKSPDGKRTIKIASIQMEIGDNSKEENIRHAEDLIGAAKGADLIILPEVWNLGYFSFEAYRSGSEEAIGESLQMVAKKAVETGAYILAGSIIENASGQFFNTSYLINPRGKVIGKYQKIHLFGYGSQESQLLTAGRDIVVVDDIVTNRVDIFSG